MFFVKMKPLIFILILLIFITACSSNTNDNVIEDKGVMNLNKQSQSTQTISKLQVEDDVIEKPNIKTTLPVVVNSETKDSSVTFCELPKECKSKPICDNGTVCVDIPNFYTKEICYNVSDTNKTTCINQSFQNTTEVCLQVNNCTEFDICKSDMICRDTW